MIILTVFTKVRKVIGFLRKLISILPRAALVTIFKSVVGPHLDYGDALYDQAFNSAFHDKLESIQYNGCLTITEAIRGTSREKLYQELGLESLQIRRWYRKLCLFYKILKNPNPQYLLNLIPVRHSLYTTRNVSNFLTPSLDFLKTPFQRIKLSTNGIN